ncbi:hypothetical protein V6N13_136704 [Hibiscus sabdariffa]
MFAGPLAEVELAGSTLANSWATLTGFAFMTGLTGALESGDPLWPRVCLECWAFEILVFLAGLMPNPEITTSLIAICVNTEYVAYMITYGLSAAASTRVSNELGAGNPNKTKHAMAVTLKLSILLVLAVVLSLTLGHDIWAGFFSNSNSIIDRFAKMTPFLIVSMAIDAIQGVLSAEEKYNDWAGKQRFQVNDTLIFKYEKGSDSVLLVKKDDYYKCEGKNPLMEMSNGTSEFKFPHSGPFFFISGKEGNCAQGQKMITVVMAVRHGTPPSKHPPIVKPPVPGKSPYPGPIAYPPKASSSSPAHSPGHTGPVAKPPTGSTPGPAQSPYQHGPILSPPSSVPTGSPTAHGPTHSPAPGQSPYQHGPISSPPSSVPTGSPTAAHGPTHSPAPGQSPYQHGPISSPPSSVPTGSPTAAHGPTHSPAPGQSPYQHGPISSPPSSVPTGSPMAHGPTHSPAPSTHYAPQYGPSQSPVAYGPIANSPTSTSLSPYSSPAQPSTPTASLAPSPSTGSSSSSSPPAPPQDISPSSTTTTPSTSGSQTGSPVSRSSATATYSSVLVLAASILFSMIYW